MADQHVDMITISREYGAGGSDFARRLGARLGWRVLDREIVADVAQRLRLDPRTVEAMDEHPPSLMQRISSSLMIAPIEMPLMVETADVLSPDAIADAAKASMKQASANPPVIIVGHGAQAMFHDRANTFHIRLVAPMESRVDRICARDGVSRTVAASEIRRMDQGRHAYVRRQFRVEIQDPLLYDMIANTGRLSIDELTDLVASDPRVGGTKSDVEGEPASATL